MQSCTAVKQRQDCLFSGKIKLSELSCPDLCFGGVKWAGIFFSLQPPCMRDDPRVKLLYTSAWKLCGLQVPHLLRCPHFTMSSMGQPSRVWCRNPWLNTKWPCVSSQHDCRLTCLLAALFLSGATLHWRVYAASSFSATSIAVSPGISALHCTVPLNPFFFSAATVYTQASYNLWV